jgi:hypothetical protein
MDDQYLIWSIDHSLWWCENSRGYTDEIERAGRFQKDRALSICKDASPRSGSDLDGFSISDIPIQVDIAKELKNCKKKQRAKFQQQYKEG